MPTSGTRNVAAGNGVGLLSQQMPVILQLCTWESKVPERKELAHSVHPLCVWLVRVVNVFSIMLAFIFLKDILYW